MRLVISSILFVGCISSLIFGCKQHDQPHEKSTVITQHASNDMTDLTAEQKISLLRTEAEKRGLRWNIICVPGSIDDFSDRTQHHYQADAELKSTPEFAHYYEDGAKDWWAETANTPEDAAYNLFVSIHNEPNMPVTHKPAPIVTKDMKDCNYNIVYDYRHKGPIPCKGK